MPPINSKDKQYLKLILDPIRVCASYKPMFGQAAGSIGLGLSEFQQLYRSDAFYSWFGLDNPLMYAAHKAAGGMTSVYRQIGIGCEQLFRRVLQDQFSLSATDVSWSYEIAATESQKARKLSLDGRLKFDDIANPADRERVRLWTMQAAHQLNVSEPVADALIGVVFEVRQGYKSKDSKRTNADIANAITAYTKGYLPCAVVLSNQIDADIIRRYRENRWAILTGVVDTGDTHRSTYDFMSTIVRYDLAGFFRRHSPLIRRDLDKVLKQLLAAQSTSSKTLKQ